MLQVLIGDDHPLFRRGVRELLSESLAPVEIGEAESGPEMLSLANEKPWDVAIMDISMPGRCGPELLEDLKKARPGMPVLVMSTHPADLFAVRVFRVGASGYLTKASAGEELIEAVKAVLAGRRYINAVVAEHLAATIEKNCSQTPHELLSDRELQVLCLLASGKSLKDIASQLCVSANTVSTYRARILEKMNMSSNAQLTSYAIQHSLIVPFSS
jgi:DNA-binding NarL/FixJ family response regulator